MRRIVGAVGWIARQSRPDLLAKTSILAQSVSGPNVLKVDHLVQANKFVKAAISGSGVAQYSSRIAALSSMT